MGVSLKRFNGWEPTTTYVYDDEGRVIASRPESEWDDTEREWFLALGDVRRREEAERCHLCGLPKVICRSKDTEGQVKVDLERCHVTTAMVKTRDLAEQDGMPYMQGIDIIPDIPNPLAGLGLGDSLPESL